MGPMRKFQHIYWPIPFSVLFLYWRFDSIKYSLKEKKWNELARLWVPGGAFLAWLPAKTVFLGVWLSGLITATIVTVTHQSEEIFIKDTLRKYDFCEAQFRSTRDAMCSNWFSDALWGGMQWQLEHHLFPTMPRYKYKALHPVLRQWSQEHGLDFRTSGELDILEPLTLTLTPTLTLTRRAGDPRTEHRAAQEDRQPAGRRGQPRLDPALQAGLSAPSAQGPADAVWHAIATQPRRMRTNLFPHLHGRFETPIQSRMPL